MKLLILVLSVILSSNSCNKDDNTLSMENTPDPVTSAQNVYYNGNIYTVNTSQPWAEAIIVEGNTITFVGSNEAALEQANSNANRVNLEGAVMLPGIHDTHLHPLEASSENFKFILDENQTNPENFVSTITAALNNNPEVDWLLGWGHGLYTLLEANRSPIEILDDISTTKPIIVMEQTSHSVWVNSKALELAGITSSTPNPTGGVYMKEEDGSLNGILIDNAGNLILNLALTPNANTLENDYQGLLYYGLVELRKHGITSVCDARTYWKRDHHKVWQRLEQENNLTVRANLGLWAYPNESDASQIATLQSLYSNDAESFLKINQIKVYNDGIVHNTTAAFDNDYLFDLFEESTNNGLNYFTETRLANYISQLESVGFDFHIHAIGSRGVSESLNAIAQSGSINGRHKITHLEFVTPTDYSRFNQLNITADCQVAGDFSNPEYWSDNNEFIDASNTQNIIPIKSLTDANARLTLSSDWDVSSLNPFVGMQNAVTRAPQNITLEQAIEAYTLNGAYVMRQESKVGSIEVGKLADFIILNQDIFTISSNEIGQTLVDLTVLNGEVIYER